LRDSAVPTGYPVEAVRRTERVLAAHLIIGLVAGLIAPATSCTFTMEVQEAIAGSADGVETTFQFSLESACRGIAVPQCALQMQNNSASPFDE
jgi:hypothetical protein